MRFTRSGALRTQHALSPAEMERMTHRFVEPDRDSVEAWLRGERELDGVHMLPEPASTEGS